MQPLSAPTSDSALRLSVDVRRLPWIRRLAIDYAHAHDRLAPFFAGNPAEPAAWTEAIGRARARQRPREALVELLSAQQAERGAPEEARAAARQLGDPSAVAVVTGQQAGLFGGPLYTLLKAITALRLASRLAREHGTPVVPVFWIDAEDHDWDEIASCGVFDGELTLHRLRAPAPEGAGERPVASLVYPDGIRDTLDMLEQVLAPTEFTAGLLKDLRAAYVPGRRVTDAFGRWLETVLGPHGLVVYDSADPAAKPLAAPVFRQELQQIGETTAQAARAGQRLVELGYHAQVTPHPQSAALFDLEQGRRAIHAADGGFRIDEEQAITPADRLIARAAERPQSFSPNVLLRPIVQDTIFPTVCYVAGPNELAYLAQLRDVYDRFAVPMPLIQPRATATILDSAGVRFLTRYRVAFEALQAQDERALNELLRTQLPPSVEQAVQEAEDAIVERLEAVIRAVPAIDPTLEGAARSTLGRLQHDMRTLRGKIVQAAKRRDETLRRQFFHVRAQAFPDGEPQERTIGFVTFLNQFGPALVDRLAAELPIDAGSHWVVTI